VTILTIYTFLLSSNLLVFKTSVKEKFKHDFSNFEAEQFVAKIKENLMPWVNYS